MRKTFTMLALVVLPALIGVASVAAQDPELDPVVADVLEMLHAAVDEGVIIHWLEATDRRPTDVGRQGMIALTEAGASERLISVLLEGVAESAEESAPEPMPAPPIAESTEVGDSEAVPGPPASSDRVEIVANLRAKQVFTDEPEPDWQPEERWDVFLYLDGELVAWTRPSLQGDPVEARRFVTAGKHEMRVVLQRYEERKGGWLHESLSVPNLVVFEAVPGAPIELEVEMRRIWGLWRQRKDGGSLRYRIRQGEEVLAENTGTGGDPNRWQPICEDVEANFPDADTTPNRFRNAMSRCVRWAELWSGAGALTDRAKILATLAQDDFEPPVR